MPLPLKGKHFRKIHQPHSDRNEASSNVAENLTVINSSTMAAIGKGKRENIVTPSIAPLEEDQPLQYFPKSKETKITIARSLRVFVF
jgi:hypothetical protein